VHFICYRIINLINGKSYIGKTEMPLDERWKDHVQTAMRGRPWKLQRAIRKYGPENFLIEHIASARNREDLDQTEIALIAQHDSIKNGYNMTEGGTGGRMSPEVIEKIRKTMTGKRHTEETKQKLRRPKSVPRSEEWRRKASERARQQTHLLQHAANWKGRKQSPEHIAARISKMMETKRARGLINGD
jgi:group I intron endonuclease